MKHLSYLISSAVLIAVLTLSGCADSENNSAGASVRSYEITVINQTQNQPFSPLAALLHTSGYAGFRLGTTASAGLEVLAESGNNSPFLTEANADSTVGGTVAGSGIIPPGMQETITVTGAGSQITLMSMLVNTNDAIAAIIGMDLGTMAVNEETTFSANAYDAGTEGNSETASEVPGPAGGGEGFNATRNDRDFIITHPGVVSMDDGLGSSALNKTHRFETPWQKSRLSASRRISSAAFRYLPEGCRFG